MLVRFSKCFSAFNAHKIIDKPLLFDYDKSLFDIFLYAVQAS